MTLPARPLPHLDWSPHRFPAVPRVSMGFRGPEAQWLERGRCKRVGLVLGRDDWEYPFWPLLRARAGPELWMEHVLVQNASAQFAAPLPGAPCVLLAVGRELDGSVSCQGRTFVERWRWTPVRVYRPEP